jgi:hypothetical protein
MLRKTKNLFNILLILPTLLFAQQENQKSLSVTVYNQNLGVVRDVRSIDLKSGISKIEVTDVAQSIDPTSVHIKLNGDVLEQNYQYDLVSLSKILQKYVDNNIQLVGNNNEIIEGTLLSSNSGQIVLRKSDGGLLMLPNIGNYRFSVGSLPEGLITRPTLLWTVNAPKSGKQNVEISYQTAGMNWHAEYVALLNNDDSKIDLNCWVSIENNSGATYKNANLKLVAGDLNLVNNTPRPAYEVQLMQKGNTASDQFKERGFFEYHIYDLQRPTTLSQNETKQISLFETHGIKIKKKYYYNSGYYYGNNPGKVSVIVEFDNTKENGLGIPLPKGKIRIYKTDGGANEFVGEDMIDHTPNKEKIKLKIGNAFDVLAEESQTDHKKISDKVFEDSYEITLKNRKQEDITIEVERNLGLNWEILHSSIKYIKKNAQTIIFQALVNKDSETKLKYTVRYSN